MGINYNSTINRTAAFAMHDQHERAPVSTHLFLHLPPTPWPTEKGKPKLSTPRSDSTTCDSPHEYFELLAQGGVAPHGPNTTVSVFLFFYITLGYLA